MEQGNHGLIVALDVPGKSEALDLVDRLGEEVSWFKIGLQLFCAEGPGLVRELRARGCNIFLDLKLHDIPNTVARAVESIAGLDVQMTTLHLGGGPEMVREALKAERGNLRILGVTVLTSSDAATLQAVGVAGPVEDQVVRLARSGAEQKIDGLVASPREIGLLRQVCGPEISLVIPGIRPTGSEVGDQKRVLTPGEAMRAGANYLVVGRPILAAPDPVAAARSIAQEMRSAKS